MVSATQICLDILEFVCLLLYTLYTYLEEIWKFVIPQRLKPLNGEVILITGTGRGIGRSIALGLAETGAKLVCWSRGEEANLEVTSEIIKRGGNAYPYTVDVGDRAQVQKTANRVKDEVGQITMVINNAGIMKVLPFLETDAEEIESLFKVNVLSNFWVLKEFLPEMLKQGQGHIVSVCSASGILPTRNIVPYSASKHAVHGYMESLRDELSHHPKKNSIKLTTAYPFYCQTEMLNNTIPNSRFPFLFPIVSPEYAAKKIIQGIRTDAEYIYTPKLIGWLAMFSWLVSTKAIAGFGKFLKVNIDPVEENHQNNQTNNQNNHNHSNGKSKSNGHASASKSE